MPRAARLIPPEGYLHVISRGNNRRKLFLRPRDFKIYYRFLTKVIKEESVRIFHYCLMPTHVHFLVGVSPESNLSRFMKRVNLKYFYYYRKRCDYVGCLWQGRFKSKVIKDDAYFIQCGKYIELNPVRAHIVSRPEDYPFSSYQHYVLGKEDPLIEEDDFFYAELGCEASAKESAYRKMLVDEEKLR